MILIIIINKDIRQEASSEKKRPPHRSDSDLRFPARKGEPVMRCANNASGLGSLASGESYPCEPAPRPAQTDPAVTHPGRRSRPSHN